MAFSREWFFLQSPLAMKTYNDNLRHMKAAVFGEKKYRTCPEHFPPLRLPHTSFLNSKSEFDTVILSFSVKAL